MIELPSTEPLSLSSLAPVPPAEGMEAHDAGPGLLGLGARLAGLVEEPESVSEILDSILTTLRGERVFLLVASAESGDDGWEVVAARSFDGEEVLNPHEKIIEPLVCACRDRREGFWTADLTAEGVFESLRRSRQPRTQSLLILPFPEPDRALYVDHRFQPLEVTGHALHDLAWLFTVLVRTSDGWRARQEKEALEEQLKDLRRQLKERRRGPKESTPSGSPASSRTNDPRGVRGDFSAIVGQSPQIVEILKLLDRVAPTNAPVLVNGESGTGKELIAHAIHANSPRRDAPFVSENCGALTETLLESELFGYVKGAFTGAYEDREGLFEVANGGTLFLDEIGDTSPALQKKLLRVLQEGKIRRVGGSDLIPVDVRIVSATNKNLMDEVRQGRFREDLFYRLNVINVLLPPLRDRPEDIPLLAEHFVSELNRETGQEKTLASEVVSLLCDYRWPGNIRELQNEVRRVHTLSEHRLDPQMLSSRVVEPTSGAGREAVLSLDRVLEKGSLREATEELEKQILAASLRRFHGNKAQICTELKIPKTTLYTKLKRYGLKSD